jgi:hypothetical protein
MPILPGKGTDNNAEAYAGQELFNPKPKIQNPKLRMGITSSA